MEKKHIGYGHRILSLLLAFALTVGMAMPGGALNRSDDAAKPNTEERSAGGNAVLALSTDDILKAVERVAGPQAVDQLQNAAEEEKFSLSAENLDTAEVFVVANDAVVPKDKDDNEVVLAEALPEIRTQSYYIDQEMEQFIATLEVPEQSKLMEQSLLETLQGLWLVKTYSGANYKAVAMLDPDTLAVQVVMINNGASTQTFSLRVVDASGNPVAVSEVSAMIQKAATQVLTPEELQRYGAQSGVSVEVLSALAEQEPVGEEQISQPESAVNEEEDQVDADQGEITLGYSGSTTKDQPQPSEADDSAEESVQDTDPTPAVPEDAADVRPSVGKLVEIEAIVIEEESVATKSSSSAPSFIVPGKSQFFGVFGDITPRGLNFTVEFYIGATQYEETQRVSAGETVNNIGKPDQSKWPNNATAFNGWYLDNATEPFDFATPITENLRLYGRFSNSYVVTYKDQNGTVIDTKSFAPGAQITEPTHQPVPEAGKHLTHWYVDKLGITAEEMKVPFVFGTAADSDLTLKPYFSNEFYVIFISTGTQPSHQTVLAGAKASKPANPTRTGYTFSHWSTEEDGAIAYDFDRPVTETLKLYAVWTGATVKLQVVYWVEAPNLQREPNPYDLDDYVYAAKKDYTAIAGQPVTLSESQADSLITDIFAERENPLRYSKWVRSDTRTVAGNGTTVVNVYYNRLTYYYHFYLGNNSALGPVGDRTKLVSGQVDYPFEGTSLPALKLPAKFQQDISAVWPEIIVHPSTNLAYTTLNNDFGGQGHVSKRFVVDSAMISQTKPRNENDADRTYRMTYAYATRRHEYHVEYWLESVDGSGTPLNLDGTIRNYVHKDGPDGYDQTIIYTGSGISAKSLDGFTTVHKEGSEANPNATVRFYYRRNLAKLEFFTGQASPIGTKSLMQGTPLKDHVPTPSLMGYTFDGWYTDADYNNKCDLETAVLPVAGIQLYAKWQSNQNKVKYYDRVGTDLSQLTKWYEQGYADNETVTFPTDLHEGDFRAGYGQFLGWYWILPGPNVLTKFTQEIPVRGDINLFAVWKTSDFKVTYDKGIGTGTPPTDDQVYDLGRNVALKPADDLIPPMGEVFYGWTVEGDIARQLYYPRNLYSIQGDTNFIAEYGPASGAYKLVFKPGYPGATEEITWYIPKGRSIFLLDDVFTRPSASMIGWHEREEQPTAQYELGALETITRDTTLYAVWDVKTRNIHFQVDDAQGELMDDGITSSKVSYLNIVSGSKWSDAIVRGVPTPLAKPGHYFVGWSPEIPGGNSIITEDKTYVAKFEKKQQIDLIAGSTSRSYDGTPLMDNSFYALGLDLSKYTCFAVVDESCTITDAGSVGNHIQDYRIIRNADNADVTDQFEVHRQMGTLTIYPCRITIIANDNSKVYGSNDPIFTAKVEGKPVAGVAVDYTVVRIPGEAVGTYPIEVHQGSNPNYSISVRNATFVITKQDGEMTASVKDGGVDETYNGEAHRITVNVTCPDNNYTVEYSLFSTGPYGMANPGKVDVADSGTVYYRVSHPNYATIEGSAPVTIRPCPVTVIANDASKPINSGDPVLTATVENKPAAGVAVNYTVTRAVGEMVGTYPIQVNVGTNPNYSGSVKNGTFTITKKTGQMTASVKDGGVEVLYDGNAHGITVEVSGATGYTIRYSATENGTYTTTQPSKVDVADSGKIYYEVSHPEHETIRGSGTVNIYPCPVTVKANDASKQLHSGDPALTATVENKPAAGVVVNYTVTRVAGEAVGIYPIQVNVGTNPNYIVTTKTGIFTITKKTGQMTATVKDGGVDVLYDGNAHGITVEVSGAAGYTIQYSATENGSYTTTQPSKVNVADSGKIYYEVSHPEHETVKGFGTVTINPRKINVRMPSVSKNYTGSEIVVIQNGILGVGGDGLLGTHTITVMGKGSGTNAGTYPIELESVVIRQGTTDVTDNYTVTPTNGTLTIVSTITVIVRIPNQTKRANESDPDYFKLVQISGLPNGVLVSDVLNITRDPGEVKGVYNIYITSKDADKYIVDYPNVGKLTIR